jgi:DNA polymerase-1
MIAAYLLGEKFLELKALALGKLGMEITSSAELESKRISMMEVSLPSVTKHASAEADVIGRLRPLLQRKLEERGLWKLFTEVEMPLIPRYPMIKQVILEIRARINHRDSE